MSKHLINYFDSWNTGRPTPKKQPGFGKGPTQKQLFVKIMQKEEVLSCFGNGTFPNAFRPFCLFEIFSV